MQYFRPGSQLRQLITMLSIVGEYPIRSLYLLGNERAYKALVHKLTTPETFRIPQTETEMTTRLLTVTGKGAAGHAVPQPPRIQHLRQLPKLRLCVCAQVLNADRIYFPFFKTGPSPSGSPMRPSFILPKN